ncbi:cytochrome b5 reductase 4 isoform X2 [Culicoides brevitarsis]|uniref:cytochrome b5 reductase 4 isoform X2 n=1 Tax=Culicoides brevitarsis TaxID=469753 RepID=UPI00307BC518
MDESKRDELMKKLQSRAANRIQMQQPLNLNPLSSSGSATGNPRNKTALKPGHSLMDWIRLGSSGVDLTGTGGVITAVSHAELAKHNKPDDCWIALRGRVYNVTRYMDFHPGGGEELMRGAGKDATALFDSVHAWVNYEQLLSKCLVGPLRNTVTIDFSNSRKASSKKLVGPDKSENAADAPTTVPADKKEIVPRFDWIQKTADIVLTFYTRALCNPGLIVECHHADAKTFSIRVFVEDVTHLFKITFFADVRWPCTIRLSSETGKIELLFMKTEPNLWTSYGTMEREKITDLDSKMYEYDVQGREELTHDSRALLLTAKEKVQMITPIGFHVNLTANINGSNITRSYTPIPRTFSPLNGTPGNIPLLVKSCGALSQYITRSLPFASQLKVSRPMGTFQLTSVKDHRRFALLAAGSGLTPMLTLMEYLLKRSTNKVEVIQLLYFNKTEADVWCRATIDALVEKEDRLIVRHILSSPSESWTGESGLVSKEQLTTLTDTKNPNHVTFISICGPVPFNNLCSQFLREINFKPDNIHFFQG